MCYGLHGSAHACSRHVECGVRIPPTSMDGVHVLTAAFGRMSCAPRVVPVAAIVLDGAAAAHLWHRRGKIRPCLQAQIGGALHTRVAREHVDCVPWCSTRARQCLWRASMPTVQRATSRHLPHLARLVGRARFLTGPVVHSFRENTARSVKWLVFAPRGAHGWTLRLLTTRAGRAPLRRSL